MLPPHVRRDLITIACQCGVDMLILFGSRAKGTAAPTSDVDIAVVGGDFDTFVCSAEAEVRSLLILDCTNLTSGISSSFAQDILRTGVLLYDRRFYVRKLDNFQGSLDVLRNADFGSSLRDPIYRMGLLGQFRLTFELGWKALQQVMREDGVEGSETGSPRELLQLGMAAGYLPDDRTWSAMLRWRNISAHVYDEVQADTLAALIQNRFLPALDTLSVTLEQKIRDAHAADDDDSDWQL